MERWSFSTVNLCTLRTSPVLFLIAIQGYWPSHCLYPSFDRTWLPVLSAAWRMNLSASSRDGHLVASPPSLRSHMSAPMKLLPSSSVTTWSIVASKYTWYATPSLRSRSTSALSTRQPCTLSCRTTLLPSINKGLPLRMRMPFPLSAPPVVAGTPVPPTEHLHAGQIVEESIQFPKRQIRHKVHRVDLLNREVVHRAVLEDLRESGAHGCVSLPPCTRETSCQSEHLLSTRFRQTQTAKIDSRIVDRNLHVIIGPAAEATLDDSSSVLRSTQQHLLIKAPALGKCVPYRLHLPSEFADPFQNLLVEHLARDPKPRPRRRVPSGRNRRPDYLEGERPPLVLT